MFWDQSVQGARNISDIDKIDPNRPLPTAVSAPFLFSLLIMSTLGLFMLVIAMLLSAPGENLRN